MGEYSRRFQKKGKQKNNFCLPFAHVLVVERNAVFNFSVNLKSKRTKKRDRNVKCG